VDAQGNPVQQTIPCPDCLVLPVAVVVNPAMAAPRVSVADKLAWPIGARQTLPQTSPGWHQARAPPRPRV
jgi:hypothetical protein